MNKIILVKNTKIACILAIALVSVFGVALNANAASTGPVTIKVDFTYTSSNIPKTTTLSNNVVVGDNVSFNLVDANGSTVFYPALSPNVQSMQARGEQGKAEFFIHYWSTESDAEGTITISGATFSSIVNEVEDLDDSWWPGSEGYKTGSEDSLTITSDTTATFNLHFNEPGDSFTLNYVPNQINQCQDGIDNDGDGAIDYPSDFSCTSSTDDDETLLKSQCQDGLDNDSDGLIDYSQDIGCSSNQDNDEFNAPINCSTHAQCGTNGLTGSPSCQGNSTYQNYITYTCNNAGTTNSFCSNSTSSQLQSNCSSSQTCSNGICNAIAQCQDGIDNDSDGATDYPGDFSCSSATDNDETNPKAQCQDGIDNDSDGLIDFPSDTGCSSKQDNDEFNAPINCSTNAQCGTNGLVGDNFCQGNSVHKNYTTYTCNNAGTTNSFCSNSTSSQLQSNCSSSQTCSNGICNAIAQCQDGIDNDSDGATDYPGDFSCSSATDNDETNPKAMCQDGIDNDGDGLIDYSQDSGCSSNQDNDEFNAPINCSTNAQCGTNGLVGDNFCQGNSVHKNYTTYTCNNAGTTNSFCSNSTSSQLQSNCSSSQTCSNGICNAIAQCQDGIDNDSDGATDYPGDFSCSSATDNDETNPKAQCQDGIDNDSDGLIDFPSDTGCSSNQDNDEFNAPINCSTNAQCGTNGLVGDNFCQGNSVHKNYTTYTCNNAGTTNSFCSNSTSSQLQSNCSSSQTCSNGICNAIAQCQDGIDNDSDGATDYPGDFS